jgi:ATP:ADP antiporter, AAA family
LKPEPDRQKGRWSPLKLFGDVRPGEGGTVLLLALNVFMLLAAYYLLKVAREPLILLGGGAEVKSYTSVGQTVLLIGATSLYGWLAARVQRMVLISCVTLFFAFNLVLFWILGGARVPLGIPFFLWVGIFNVVTIAQFWSFAADTYTDEQGRRLFPIVGIGSSVGAVGGAWLAEPLIRRSTPFTLMLVAAGLLLLALGITYLINRREITVSATARETSQEPIAAGNAFALVFRDRYLLIFALVVLVLNFVTKTGDYLLDRMLLAQAPEHARALHMSQAAYIGQFKAHYFQWINSAGVLMQLFVVSRVIKHAGLRASLVLIPIASVCGYGTTLLFPMLSVLFVGRVVESSLDYSLSSTTQQSLWLVTSRAAKYKAKQVVDAFFKRAGDTLSAGLVWISAHFLLETRSVLAVNVGLTILWLGLAVLLGKDYAARGVAAAGLARPLPAAITAPAQSA